MGPLRQYDTKPLPRAHRLWWLLSEYADRRESLTFASVLEMFGCRARQVLLFYLHAIELHCAEERLPPLAWIVEDAPRLRPLRNDVNADIFVDPEKMLRQVFEHRWFDSKPPTEIEVRAFRGQIREIEAEAARRGREPEEPPPPSERRLTSRALQKEVSEQLDALRRRARAPKPRVAKAKPRHLSAASAPKPKKRRSSPAAKAKPTHLRLVPPPTGKPKKTRAATPTGSPALGLVPPPKAEAKPKAKKKRPPKKRSPTD